VNPLMVVTLSHRPSIISPVSFANSLAIFALFLATPSYTLISGCSANLDSKVYRSNAGLTLAWEPIRRGFRPALMHERRMWSTATCVGAQTRMLWGTENSRLRSRSAPTSVRVLPVPGG
jgi:hypothetical protein